MQQYLGFTLIELLITLSIAAILVTLGGMGYMDTLKTERRKDAIISLQKAALIINAAQNGDPIICPTNQKSYSDSNTDCNSDAGFYYINYNSAGFSVSTSINNKLINEEVVYLKATAIGSQAKDNQNGLDCTTMYLTNLNNLHPIECVN